MGFRKKGDTFEGAELSMAITPMLDLAFQLLAFFIITYHPSQLQEGQMTLNLPDAAQAQAANPKEAQPDSSLPGDIPLPSEVTVIVKTQHDGSNLGTISEITVQETQGKKAIPDPEELRKYLKQIRATLTNQKDIKLQADSGLRYSHVMEIMDRCTQAGFNNVSFGPPADVVGQ